MWDQAEFTIPELVDMAVACINKETDSFQISGSDNSKRFRRLMPILTDKLDEEDYGWEYQEGRYYWETDVLDEWLPV